MKKSNKSKKNTDKNLMIRSSAAEFLTFVSAVGGSEESIEIRYENEDIWMTQKMIAELYGVSVLTIRQHLNTLIENSEIDTATIKQYLIVQKEGGRAVKRNIDHYNLHIIISLGFKIENERSVQFRKWARQIVKEYAIKGFAMDDERLDRFIKMTDRKVLNDARKVTAELAKDFAESEFEKYRIVQDRLFESDFDQEMKKILKPKK